MEPTSFNVYVYRKEISKEKYAYTVAFRGSQQWEDWVVDYLQVGKNVEGLQAEDAAAFVRQLIHTDFTKMSHMYITGHSLGGYLAQWVQSEMIDGVLPWVESFTVTFNAPGFNPLMKFIDNGYKAKVLAKLKNDKDNKYDGLIINHRIDQDIISCFGDDLGTVYVYDSTVEGGKEQGFLIEYYHDLARLQVQIDKFGFKVEAVALDAGYFTGYICKELSEQNIFMVMGYRRLGKRNQEVPKSKFKYEKETNVFACPMDVF
ncbi:DUF2974 domain-containing protein [Bacillus paramycoides]|uniref:prolyl oligopeptidase family serine peptidase n=1 Tax=Bacillus paramycoides TaxID=2026194 RepID=UPI0015BA3648|nr:DUF2974 domain-containing protein [Bacillus paramycoides]